MKKPIYFDNAATTQLDEEVLEAMYPYLTRSFGNPSTIYGYGRENRLAVEKARKTVADILGVKSSTIIFTSGGTESNNTAIAAAIRDLNCKHIITSPIEHHAVLHTVEHYSYYRDVSNSFVSLTEEGRIDFEDLENQLREKTTELTRCLVTLMHGNNETGAITDIKRVGELCRKYDAIFHSDCVQTVGHYPIDLSKIYIHFVSASGHKFHGPKGTGILYVNENTSIQPLIVGGSQERSRRGGTENVYGIVGFATALEKAMKNYAKDSKHIAWLKDHMTALIRESFDEVEFNTTGESLYTILSVSFPSTDQSDGFLFDLDQNNICASGGSACSTGSKSHVMKALQKAKRMNVRFSFSKYNNIGEVEEVVYTIQKILKNEFHSA